jgi:predicted RNA-binding Zn-ribbon protein involved in translation (DUF1610 family)
MYWGTPKRGCPVTHKKMTEENQMDDTKTLLEKAVSSETKVLTFKCPKCGGNRLQWDMHTPHYQYAIVRAIEVDEDGNSDYSRFGCYIGGNPALWIADDMEYGSTWSCSQCEHVITDDDGQPIDDESSLVAWMLLHGEVIQDLSELEGSPDEIESRCI